MKTREKQNKHKLKFDYIAQLQMLGKIWKEHSNLVNPDIPKTNNTYNNEVVKLMSNSKKDTYLIEYTWGKDNLVHESTKITTDDISFTLEQFGRNRTGIVFTKVEKL